MSRGSTPPRCGGVHSTPLRGCAPCSRMMPTPQTLPHLPWCMDLTPLPLPLPRVMSRGSTPPRCGVCALLTHDADPQTLPHLPWCMDLTPSPPSLSPRDEQGVHSTPLRGGVHSTRCGVCALLTHDADPQTLPHLPWCMDLTPSPSPSPA
ncbi:MAG: hypothetical protein WDW38_009965 [Sanguina aurantia]